MVTAYTDDEADLKHLLGKRVRILGYGIQGRAQARNLTDSGLDVAVGLRPGSASRQVAQQDGVPVRDLAEAVTEADVLLVLTPDETHEALWKDVIAPNLRPSTTLAFAHGFSILYGTVKPPKSHDVILVAPKAPGQAVRQAFEQGHGVPVLVAVAHDESGNALDVALAIAKGIGSTRAGVLATTFQEEVETDLFGEQAVLCGGMSSLIEAGFATLVGAGYQPEVAYFEVLHELKLIVDLVQEGGLEHMWARVSNTAEYGGRTQGPNIIDAKVVEAMEVTLANIQSGAFAHEWLKESRSGAPRLAQLRKAGSHGLLEEVGRDLRARSTQRMVLA